MTATEPRREEATAPSDHSPPDVAAIYRQYSGPLFVLCFRLLAHREAAQDAVGEIFLQLPRALKSYDAAQPFARWLYRVASNHCLDLLRARCRQRECVSIDEEEARMAASPAVSPLDAIENAERDQRLHRAIAELPEQYRVPLVLRHFAGLDYESIGAQLGLTANHVGILLFRARQELRRRLGPPEEGRKT